MVMDYFVKYLTTELWSEELMMPRIGVAHPPPPHPTDDAASRVPPAVVAPGLRFRGLLSSVQCEQLKMMALRQMTVMAAPPHAAVFLLLLTGPETLIEMMRNTCLTARYLVENIFEALYSLVQQGICRTCLFSHSSNRSRL